MLVAGEGSSLLIYTVGVEWLTVRTIRGVFVSVQDGGQREKVM